MMSFYGSNYPSNYPANQNYAGSYYPQNSGPPPPPGYMSQPSTFGPYSQPPGGIYAQPPNYHSPYQQMGQQIGGMWQEQTPPVVYPNQIPHIQKQFTFEPTMQNNVPSAPEMPYSSYVNTINDQMTNQQNKQLEEMQRSMAEMAAEMRAIKEEKNKPSQTDAEIKAEVRKLFIDEMLRRQKESGTFEITEGTIREFIKYDSQDPVASWYQSKKNLNIFDQKWDPEYDCEFLRGAMKGLGTDEAKIIHIVATRNNTQRQILKEKFKTMYGRDLISDIKSELSGDFKETVMACFVPPAEYDAWSVKQAIYGLGTNEKALIEIFMTRTNKQIEELRQVYPEVIGPKKFADKRTLEKDIKGDTSGDFKRLLMSASQGKRDELTREHLEKAVEEVYVNGQPTGTFHINYQKLVDMDKVKRDALRLYKAGEDRWGTDEEEFNIIFSTRDYYHLREVWNEYVKISQRDILNSIKRETSGDFMRGLKAIVTNIRCRPLYFAERLKEAMKGLGTDDKTLIRVVVSRSEIDMVQIKKCFLDLTKQTLWRWIKDDTSGDYKRLLQALVGKD